MYGCDYFSIWKEHIVRISYFSFEKRVICNWIKTIGNMVQVYFKNISPIAMTFQINFLTNLSQPWWVLFAVVDKKLIGQNARIKTKLRWSIVKCINHASQTKDLSNLRILCQKMGNWNLKWSFVYQIIQISRSWNGWVGLNTQKFDNLALLNKLMIASVV